MNKDKQISRLRFLKDQHQRQHQIVEALEAEKAPRQLLKITKDLNFLLKMK